MQNTMSVCSLGILGMRFQFGAVSFLTPCLNKGFLSCHSGGNPSSHSHASVPDKICLHDHSSMGSKEKSARLSAPHTDQRFLSLLLLRLLPRISNELLRLDSPPSPSSTLNLPSSPSRIAASSASGASSIVSSELIDGDRDLSDVGVLGMLEAELKEYIGYGS